MRFQQSHSKQVNKSVSGLLKLLYPDQAQPVEDADLEWAVRLALEVRRPVKEQRKRIGSAEFRNTQCRSCTTPMPAMR
jgi:ATP-dependent Lon protease